MFRAFLVVLCAFSLLERAKAEETIIELKPRNTVEFTCTQFKEKAAKCEPYTCQTPFSLDPTIKTEWEIMAIQDDRCTVSYTTNDIGLKDSEKNPIPITQTCDYDAIGIQKLIDLMDDMENGYFRIFAGENSEGAYNCKLTSQGKPLQSDPNIPANAASTED